MKHRASRSFWRSYSRLSKAAKRLADKNFELFKADPSHPSLHFKLIEKY